MTTNYLDIQKYLDDAWHERQIADYEASKTMVEKAEGLCKKDDYEYLGRTYHIYMQIEADHDNYKKALEWSLKSCDCYQKSENHSKMAHSTRHLADLQLLLGHWIEAETNYLICLDLHYKLGKKEDVNLANAMRGYTLLLEKQKRPEEAITFWGKVAALYTRRGISGGVEEAIERIVNLKT